MQIWVDNDGCPKVVRELVIKTSERRDLSVVFVGNKSMKIPSSSRIRLEIVQGTFDAADIYIIEHVEPGDLVITADTPLAREIVAKGAIGLNPHGEVFDSKNIGDRLATRNLLQELRSTGEVWGGAPPFSDGDKKRFANALDRLITMLLRQDL